MKKKILMLSMITLLLNIISCDLDNRKFEKSRDKKIEAKIKIWNKLEENAKYININIKYDITVKLTIKDWYRDQEPNEYQETIRYGESKEILVSWIAIAHYYEEEYNKTEIFPVEIDLEIIESHGYVEDENGTKQYDDKYYPTDIYYHFPSAVPYLTAKHQYHIIKISNKKQINEMEDIY